MFLSLRSDLLNVVFTRLETAVEEDVEFLKKTKLAPDDVVISGWVYEVETGKVRQVV